MAFESLSDRFQRVFKKLRGQTRLTESNMDEMLKEIRVALLEADVNFKVVKSFVSDIKEKAVGQDVYDKVNPSQMVVKIVHDEMCNLLGEDQSDLKLHNGLSIIMLVGLQGTGKTTTAGKLSKLLMKRGKKVMLAALDVYRPAAIDQLRTIATEVGADFFSKPGKPSELCLQARDEALAKGEDVLITGAGPIGILATAICKYAGARRVIVTDLNDYRLGLAHKMGADAVVNTSRDNLEEAMSKEGLVEGFDVGLEMSGSGAALKQMLSVMRNGGKISLLGLGNGCPYNETGYCENYTDTYFGEALAVVRASEDAGIKPVVIEVTDGKRSGLAEIETE